MSRVRVLFFLVIPLLASCSFNSYLPEYTEVDMPQYHIPDSLAVFADTNTMAAMVWQDYYSDTCLRKLIDEGLRNNPTLHIAMLQIEKAQSYCLKTVGDFAPILNFAVSQNQQKRPFRDTPYNEHGFGFTMTRWELDLWGKIRSTRKAALSDLLARESSAQAVKVRLIADIAKNYYKLVGLDAKLMVVNDMIVRNEEFLDAQMSLLGGGKAGRVAVSDRHVFSVTSNNVSISHVAVEQAKAELYKVRAVKPDIEAAIFVTENALNMLLGRASGTIERASLDDMVADNSFIHDTLAIGVPAQLLRYRPDVMAAEYDVKRAFHLQDAAKAAMFPALTLSGTIRSAESYNVDWSNFPSTISYNLFAGLTQPLLNHGMLKYNKRLREIEAQQKIDTYRQTVLGAYFEVSNLLVHYRISKDKMENMIKQNSALTAALTYSMMLYKNKKASYLDVLAAQRPIMQARMQLADAFVQYYSNNIDLYKALGGGSVL